MTSGGVTKTHNQPTILQKGKCLHQPYSSASFSSLITERWMYISRSLTNRKKDSLQKKRAFQPPSKAYNISTARWVRRFNRSMRDGGSERIYEWSATSESYPICPARWGHQSSCAHNFNCCTCSAKGVRRFKRNPRDKRVSEGDRAIHGVGRDSKGCEFKNFTSR